MLTTRVVTRRVMRMLAACALLAGVVAMHHVATASPGEAAAVAAVEDAGPAAAHHGAGHSDPFGVGGAGHADDLLHLCVAVAVSAVLVALGWLPARRRVLYRVGWPRSWVHRQPRPRSPRVLSGAALLTSLCVMRT